MVRDPARYNAGVTLLELAVAMGIFTALMGVLFSVSLSLGDSARVQEVKVNAGDEARRALLLLTPRLRQAAAGSINTEQLPGEVLRFRMADDVDGNGTAVNAGNALELGPEIAVLRDDNDLNEDGLTASQLILIDGDRVRVLANNLAAPRTGPDAGFVVEAVEGRISVTVRTEGHSRRGHPISQSLTQLVTPRN